MLARYTAKNPTDPDGYLQLAQLEDQLGQPAATYDAYVKYLHYAPPGATATAVQNQLPTLAKIRDAAAVTIAHPKDAVAWSGLSKLYVKALNASGAFHAATQATQLAPKNPDYMNQLASIYALANQPTVAQQIATAYTLRNPKDPMGFYYLGQLAKAAKATLVAEQAYTTYLKLAPHGPKAAAATASLVTLKAGK